MQRAENPAQEASAFPLVAALELELAYTTASDPNRKLPLSSSNPVIAPTDSGLNLQTHFGLLFPNWSIRAFHNLRSSSASPSNHR